MSKNLKNDSTNSKNEVVSIIVPIYNAENYLETCLNSLTKQTYKNLEIMLVDDGSPDNSGKICDEWAKNDSRIKVIHKKNGGVMSAWTTGFNNSTGNFIAFVDPDDYIELNTIEKAYAALTSNHANIVMFGYNTVFGNKVIAKEAYNDTVTNILENKELDLFKQKTVEQINSYTPFYKCNKLFERQAILNNLKYCNEKVSLGDDVCICLGAILDAKKIVVLEDKLYNYIQRSNSIIHKYNNTLPTQMQILLEEIKTLLTDKNYYSNKAISFEIARMLFILTRNCINSPLTKKEKKIIYKELVKGSLATELRQNNIKHLPKTYKIFVKIFLTNSYFLNNLFIKLFNIIKRKKLK